MAALSPYMARVLGLYFVDRHASPGRAYDYFLVGVWPEIVPPVVRSPGSAPAGALARGSALFDGMSIVADPAESHLYAWQSDGSSPAPPATLPGTPPAVTAALAAAVAPLAASDRPPALLAADVNPPRFPFRPRLREVTACDIGLLTPVAEIALSVAGDGRVVARSGGVEVASVAVSASTLVWCPLVSPDPAKQPID